MSTLYKRRVVVQIGDDTERLRIENLFITFEVKRSAEETAAEGSIRIFNLNESTETRIRERGVRVRLFAGYEEGRYGLLVDGDVRRVDRKREGHDRVTIIEYGGQVEARTNGIVDVSYSGSVSTESIIRYAVSNGLGLDMPVSRGVLPTDALEDFRYVGPAERLLTMLLRPHRLRWYEDNGVIRVSRIGSAGDDRRGSDVLVVSEQTGMIGSPTLTEDGIKVRTLIDPRIGLDQRIRIESEVQFDAAAGDAIDERAVEESGEYKVVSLTHSGDSREGNFETNIEARPLTE